MDRQRMPRDGNDFGQMRWTNSSNPCAIVHGFILPYVVSFYFTEIFCLILFHWRYINLNLNLNIFYCQIYTIGLNWKYNFINNLILMLFIKKIKFLSINCLLIA
jgi:hypothetical protein